MRKRSKWFKRMVAVLIAVCMLTGIVPPGFELVEPMKVEAATFNQVNQSDVFLKQAKGSVTCTLVAAAMLLRRAAMMYGKSDWASITESSLRSTAWVEG